MFQYMFCLRLCVQALGCLLYEMCALQPAFDANNLISLIYKIVKGDFEVRVRIEIFIT